MLSATTAQDFAHYHLKRTVELPYLAQQLSWLYGLPNISINVDNREANACRLTTDGVIINLNAASILQLSQRHDFGVKGILPLAMADMLSVAHQLERVRDFCAPGFFIEKSRGSPAEAQARRFFNSVVDDLALGARMRDVPLFCRYFNSFLSRLVRHDLRDWPLHIQLMCALRVLGGETDPLLSVAPEIERLIRRPAQREVLELLTAGGLGFAARRAHADARLYPLFQELLQRDLVRYDSHLLRDLYAQANPFGETGNDDARLLGATPGDKDSEREDIQRFYTTTKENLADIAAAAADLTGETTEDRDDGAPGLMLPRSGESPEELQLEDGDGQSYLSVAHQWRRTITKVAETLLELALPQERIAVPRYRARASIEGIRLNPRALPAALIQLKTENPQAIWQPVRQLIRHQEREFSGLDIFFLVDVSGSMSGGNAPFATATSICLVEGLQLASDRARRDQTQAEVDVRLQILAFGAGWAELTPLTRRLSRTQKELLFYNLMHPKSNFTKVNGALRQVRATALANPTRQALCFMVSDGLFSDNLAAFKTMQSMPRQVYTSHLNIGDDYAIPITPHFDTITNPKLLPQKLYRLLEDYLNKHSRSGQVPPGVIFG
jgi:uncharacterized protein YegL